MKKRLLWMMIILCLVFAAEAFLGGRKIAAQSSSKAKAAATREIPTFQVDPTFPKTMPNDWVMGPASGITVDSMDHIWVITRSREPDTPAQKAAAKNKTMANPVLEFDQAGTLIQAWGGAGDGENYQWPATEHGITVDQDGNVWIAGRGTGDAQILKFSNGGKFLIQIGHSKQSKGNTDTMNLNLPADVTPYPKGNEIFVADGYGNRRVIVFDMATGQYKRMWSAFGNTPTDPAKGEPVFTKDEDAHGKGPDQFSTNVHGVRISNDGLVYVCDRRNQRIQVFTTEGKYITQVFIDRGLMPDSTATGELFGKTRAEVENGLLHNPEAASRTAFSQDPQQKYLFVLARRHQKIYILDRKTLQFLGSFGDGVGDEPGSFYVMHDMATDSKGNFYTAEINDHSGVQKFNFKGLKAMPIPTVTTQATNADGKPMR